MSDTRLVITRRRFESRRDSSGRVVALPNRTPRERVREGGARALPAQHRRQDQRAGQLQLALGVTLNSMSFWTASGFFYPDANNSL